MTMTLAHPPAEDLGRFVEGTLDDAARAAVVEHIADCDECRLVVVDTTAFGEESVTSVRGTGGRWWLSIAAAVGMAIIGGAFLYREHRNPLAALAAACGQLTSRPVEGQLSGFPYRPWEGVKRGGSDEDDSSRLMLGGPAADVLGERGDDAKTLHAKGVTHLVVGERVAAIADLTAATRKAPNDATYWSDLAAAQTASGDYEHALASADHALRLNNSLAAALFNRAVALKSTGDSRKAVEAYRRYLRIDSHSEWGKEAHQQIEQLERSTTVP